MWQNLPSAAKAVPFQNEGSDSSADAGEAVPVQGRESFRLAFPGCGRRDCVGSGLGGAGFACGVALPAELFHNGLDEGFGAFHAGENGLQIEGRLCRVAARGAVDAMLADHDEGIGEQVEGDGEAAALGAHHELVLFELGAFFVKDVHRFKVLDAAGGARGGKSREVAMRGNSIRRGDFA